MANNPDADADVGGAQARPAYEDDGPAPVVKKRRTKNYKLREDMAKSRRTMVAPIPPFEPRTFESWEEFIQAWTDYMSRTKTLYRRRSSSTTTYWNTKNKFKKFPVPESFQYATMAYWCTHGCIQPSRSNGVRTHLHNRYTGCAARITADVVFAPIGGGTDEVRWFIRVRNQIAMHNHRISDEIYNCYSNNSSVPDELLLGGPEESTEAQQASSSNASIRNLESEEPGTGSFRPFLMTLGIAQCGLLSGAYVVVTLCFVLYTSDFEPSGRIVSDLESQIRTSFLQLREVLADEQKINMAKSELQPLIEELRRTSSRVIHKRLQDVSEVVAHLMAKWHQGDDNNQTDRELFLADYESADCSEFAEETSSIASSDSSGIAWSEGHGIITAVRVRPMLPSEKNSGYRRIIDMGADSEGSWTRIVNPTALSAQPATSSWGHTSTARLSPLDLALEPSAPATSTHFPAQFTQKFKFDYSFWSFDQSPGRQIATQSTIYDELGVFALQTTWEGFNCSIFAYGQTVAGKTYTMMGYDSECMASTASSSSSERGETEADESLSSSERRGLIPRICEGLFAGVEEAQGSSKSCSVLVSYVEIYHERVYDLLNQANTKVREHPEDGMFVERAHRVRVASYADVAALINEGNRMRSVGSSAVNRQASRSHTVLTLFLIQNTRSASGVRGDGTTKKSKICLVDLAGSERVDHSSRNGLHLREAATINRSLATLAGVVGALSKRRSRRSKDASQYQRSFVPYRNSVLTRLLKENLGGNAKTIMLGSISPCCAHYEESLGTLKYIERTKNVSSTVRVNVDTSRDLEQELQGELYELRAKLQASGVVNPPERSLSTSNANFQLLGPTSSNVSYAFLANHGHDSSSLRSEPAKDDSTAVLPRVKEESFEPDRRELYRLECEVAKLKVALREREHDFHVGKLQDQVAAQISRQNMHLQNLVAIRRRCHALQLYRALDVWRRGSLDVRGSESDTVNAKEEEMGPEVDTHIAWAAGSRGTSSNGKARHPPLHSPISSAEKHTNPVVGRVQEVLAAVVEADALCCSVVKEFVFSRHTESAAILPHSTSSLMQSVSPLELLASSAEFDRPGVYASSTKRWEGDSPQLFELASAETWSFGADDTSDTNEETEQPGEGTDTDRKDDDYAPPPPSALTLSPVSHPEEDSVRAALSLCIDSIDMARRSLGPCMRKLRQQADRDSRTVSETGIERELLVYLDRKFVTMSQRLENLLTLLQSPSATSRVKDRYSGLEATVGEFCLQIIARLCDQLPSASSGCVAGRYQLETQLERFCNELKHELLPSAVRSGGDGSQEELHGVLFVIVELVGIAERIGFVWHVVEQRQRQRLLQTQALAVSQANTRQLSDDFTALKARNSGLLVAMRANSDDLMAGEPAMKHGPWTTSENKRDFEAALASEVAHAREVEVRNDELVHRFATLNHELAAALDRVLALETENSQLRTSQAASAAEEGARMAVLEQELSDSRNCIKDLKDQVIALGSVNAEQSAKLQTQAEDTQLQVTKLQLSESTARLRELEAARAAERQANQQAVNESQVKLDVLSASIERIGGELNDALERNNELDGKCAQLSEEAASLSACVTSTRSERDSIAIRAEEATSRCVVLEDRLSAQAAEVASLETRIGTEAQQFQELEMRAEALMEDRDALTITLSQTEEALAFARERGAALEDGELSEVGHLERELHDATLETASLREELTELLDQTTLQSVTIEKLETEQLEAAQRAQEWELEREELTFQYQMQSEVSEQKEEELQLVKLQSTHWEEQAASWERQLEIERQTNVITLDAFQKLQTRHDALETDNCQTIGDLEKRLDESSTEVIALEAKLKARETEIEVASTNAMVQMSMLANQVQQAEAKLVAELETSRVLAKQLRLCQADLNGSTRRWIQAETQCTVQRISMRQLTHYLAEFEAKDGQRIDEHQGNLQTTSEATLAVHSDLSHLDTWFNEMISGNQVPRTTSQVSSGISVDLTEGEEADTNGKTTEGAAVVMGDAELNALTDELLDLCTSRSEPAAPPNNQPHATRNAVEAEMKEAHCPAMEPSIRLQLDVSVDTVDLELSLNPTPSETADAPSAQSEQKEFPAQDTGNDAKLDTKEIRQLRYAQLAEDCAPISVGMDCEHLMCVLNLYLPPGRWC
ncbi:hypothetical protein BBJ28_00013297 [Nothophytophthora sp. Chile5]|nr:hypothetical protein BBJ28_00013297 [Nothophytophthora sp. Chile5]